MQPSSVLSPPYSAGFPPVLAVGSVPVKLRLQPQPEAVAYAVAATWEEYVNGAYKTSTVQKQVSLGVRTGAEGYEVEIRTAPPAVAKQGDLEPLEQLALRLAALYERVVVDVSPTGELRDVLNHAQLLQTWETLRTSLRESTTDDDVIIPKLVAAVDRQLADKANVRRSLRHDYVYETLVKNIYDVALAPGRLYARSRGFSRFFADVDLCFAEQLEVAPAEAAGHVRLTCTGKIDAQQTDVPAVHRAIESLLRAEGPAAAPPAADHAPARPPALQRHPSCQDAQRGQAHELR